MATQDIERLIVSLEASTTKYERAMARAQAQTNKAAKGIETRVSKMNSAIGASLSSFGKGLAGSLIAGFAVDKVAAAVHQVVTEVAKIADTANKIGIGVEPLQELQFAAKQSGVELGDLDTALSQFGKRLGDASRGGGDLYKVLQANGVAIRDQAGDVRPLTDLLGDYANLIRGAGSEQEQLTLATTAFGRSGDDMVLMLKDGSAGLEELQRRARDAGAVVRKDLVEAAAKLDDRWEEFTSSMTTKWRTFVLSVVDGLEDIRAQMNRGFGEPSLGAQTGQLLAGGNRAIATEELRRSLATGGDTTLWQGRDEWLGQPIKKTALPAASSGSKEDSWQKETRQIAEATAELMAQRAALAGLNPLVNDYGYAIEKAKAESELLAAAQKEGLAITQPLKEQIAGLAEQYAQATVALEQTREAQGRLAEAWSMVGEGAWNAFEGVITGAQDAKSAVLDLIKQILLAEAKAQFMSAFGGSSGGGPISAILGSLFGGARAAGGPVRKGVPYVVGEKRAELFVPSQNGMILPKVPSAGASTRAAGPSVQIRQSFDFSGVDPSSVARILAAMPRIKDEAVAAAVVAVRQQNQQRPNYLRGGK